MKILVQNSDHVVFYAGDDITLTATGTDGDGWRDPHFTTANATIVEAELPANWTGAAWTHNTGVWAVHDSAAHAVQLGKARSEIWERIKALRDHKTQTNGYTAAGKWFHSDLKSQVQQQGLFMMGASVPAVQWKTMDGSFATMTQTLAGQIFAAAAASEQALFTHAEVLRAAVYASADPTSVDITAGWPAGYGE